MRGERGTVSLSSCWVDSSQHAAATLPGAGWHLLRVETA